MKIAIQIEGFKRNNIGDVFQAIAIKDHLTEVDYVFDREALNQQSDKGSVLLFANGWYMHNYVNFPPSSNITPIYTSVHFSNAEILNSSTNRDHFRKYAPIGARDLKTLIMLRAANIPSYYSSCFTIGIKRRSVKPEQARMLVVDGVDHPLASSDVREIEERLAMSAQRVTHDPTHIDASFEEYSQASFEHAESLLRQYCAAKCIITTKIHCALPCLAMGVPVILIHPNPKEERLKPVRDYLPIIQSDRIDKLDLNLAIRSSQDLISRRKEFCQLFISEALRLRGNPIALSKKFSRLKLHSQIQTQLWYMGLCVAHKVGFQRNRLSKIFGSEFCS